MRAFRISNARYFALDGTGAAMQGGRWNSPGRGPVYACETYSGALLEILVRVNVLTPPPNLVYTVIEIPDEVPREEVHLMDVSLEDETATRRLGNAWYDGLRSAVLFVPSAVTRVERNIVLNTRHEHFSKIQVSDPQPVWWDRRLFKHSPAPAPPEAPGKTARRG